VPWESLAILAELGHDYVYGIGMCAIHSQGVAEGQEMALRPEFEAFDRYPDPALDELTELAAVLLDADYAYIGWMGFNRLWFKSQYGFKAPDQPGSSTACQWMLESGRPLLISDAGQDARFSRDGIPLAEAKPCRSYAGVPLITSKQKVVGSLAVLSQKPEWFSQEHIGLLEILARQVVTRLELCSYMICQEQARRARQRAERTLSSERLLCATAMDSIPFLVALLDPAGRIVRLNDSFLQLTGLTVADAVGCQFVERVLEPEDRTWASAMLRDAAEGKVSGPQETTWRIAGGSVRPVSWTLRPVPGVDGNTQYVIVIGQDTTDRQQSESMPLTMETRYRQMVENSLGFLFTCTLDAQITSMNTYTAETLGYQVKDLVGQSVSLFLDHEGTAVFHEGLQSLEAGEEWQGRLRVRRSDGIFRRIAFRSRRMELPGERPFVINHGFDVTEQHEAEEALHVATHQRELILESVGDGIYGVDLNGNLTFINQAGAKILGYTPFELTGRDIHEIIHHTHADGTPYSKTNSPILQGLRRNQAVRMRDEVFWRNDGTAIPVEYSATPLLEDGQISGMVVAFQDISERRRLGRMKDEFISTVSHELRTPLTSLRASLGLVASGALDKRPEKQRQMLTMAIGNCDRLVRLVNDILDFNSGEKGKLPLHRQPIEAADLMRRAADVARTPASDVHITFRIDATPATVLADEDRVLQVLNELVTNALKFSPPETMIRLVTQRFGNSEVCFIVEDQGRGIAPEKLEHIFDRFQQGDASDTRSLGGTGLGLALCRSIVEQHGGRIWAESSPGQGSRFLFTLPAAVNAT
jgi:PAS domain S-box-containing protein